MRIITLILAIMLSGLLLRAQTGEPCTGEPTVTYEGQTYNTIVVGDRCWLKENLNVGTMILSNQDQTNNSVIEKYCYGDLPANCETYGGFYQWKEAMQYDATPGAQGICPPGWRIPTDDEWKMLEGAADSQFNYGDPEWNNMNFRGFDAGKNLKADEGWMYNGNGLDNLGAAILPGGHRDFCGAYYSEGHSNYMWTSTQQDDNTAWYRILASSSGKVSRRYAHKNMGATVRCIKDLAPPQPFSCGESFTDNRDGESYTTVQIGDQCWMAENLAYLPEVSPSSQGTFNAPYYYVYDYQGTDVNAAKATDHYSNYGVLYNWPASLGACPEGWHLPNDDEWIVLISHLDGLSLAGGKLKSTRTEPDSHPRWKSPNTGATNSSSFSGLPGGFRYYNGYFGDIGDFGYWWTSTETASDIAWGRYLGYIIAAGAYRDPLYKEMGLSVRCVRD